MQLGLGVGLSKQRKGIISGEIPAVGGDPPGSFDGFETPPTIATIADTVVVSGKTKAGFIGKFVVPLGDLIADRVYNINFVADLSGLAQGGAKAGFGFGMKNGNSFCLTLLQGDGAGVNAVTVRGSPPNGWNKQTGHTTANGGAPTSGTQHAADVQLVTNAGGDAYTFSTSGDDQETWDAELEDQPLTPFTDVTTIEQFGIAGWFASDDAGEFIITVTWTEEAGAPFFLDDTSPTGAWSLSRNLLSTYSGDYYVEIGGAITQIDDQVGTSHLTDGGTSSRRPAEATAGPNSVACADFNGTSNRLDGPVISTFWTESSKFAVISFIVDAVTTTYQLILGTADTSMFIAARNPGGGGNDKIEVANFDGNADIVNLPAGAVDVDSGVPLVVTLRHEGGTWYGSLNGGAEVSIASGDSTFFTSTLQMSGGGDAFWFNGKVFEAAMWDTVPDAPTRAAIVANLMSHAGAT